MNAKSDDAAYDFFVSYARHDNTRGWVSGFVAELLAAHRQFSGGRELSYFLDDKEIKTGADFAHTVEHGLARSRLFLAFLSPHYFASEWCRREWRAWIDHEIAAHILTQGLKPVCLVKIDGFDGPLDERTLAQQIAEFCGQRPPAPGFIEATDAVLKQARRRQFLGGFAQPLEEAGIAALHRPDLQAALSTLAREIADHSEVLALGQMSHISGLYPIGILYLSRHKINSSFTAAICASVYA